MLKLFARAISNDEKVEIEIQREAVQLTDGAGQKLRALRGIPNPIAADVYVKVK